MNKLENTHIYSKKKMVLNSFLGGIFWGAGSVIGAAIVIILFGFFASRINVIPILGDFVTQVGSYVESQRLQTPNPFSNTQN